MSMNVWVKAGKVYNLLNNRTNSGSDTSVYKDSVYSTFQAFGTTTSGSGAATIQIQGSNDNTNWVTIGTISLTLGTTATNDAFANQSTFKWVRANVSSISGTGASVSVTMGV